MGKKFFKIDEDDLELILMPYVDGDWADDDPEQVVNNCVNVAKSIIKRYPNNYTIKRLKKQIKIDLGGDED